MLPFTDTVRDEDFEKLPEVADVIEEGQARIWQWLARYAKEHVLTREIIEQFHRTVFGPVFPRAAGKTRGTDPDAMYDVEIGNAAMGTRHKDVAREFDECSAKLAAHLASLDAHIAHPPERRRFFRRVARRVVAARRDRAHPSLRQWQRAHLAYLRQLRRLSL